MPNTLLIMKKLILLSVLGWSIHFSYAQRSVSFVEEYAIINEVFNPGQIKPLGPVPVFFLTSDVKFWPIIFQTQQTDCFGNNCEENLEFAKSNLSKLYDFNYDVMMTELDPSKLSENIALEKKMAPMIKKITFPLIVEDYGFVLVMDESYQLLYILKKDPQLGWKVTCQIILYQGPLT